MAYNGYRGYVVCANISDGTDYIKHYFGGFFKTYAEAHQFFLRWEPNSRDVDKVVKKDMAVTGQAIEKYDLQIGTWNTKTGKDHDFISYGIPTPLTAVMMQPV